MLFFRVITARALFSTCFIADFYVPCEVTGVTLRLGLWCCLTLVELLFRLTLFSMEVSLETVRLGTCGAEAILLWLREGLLTLDRDSFEASG